MRSLISLRSFSVAAAVLVAGQVTAHTQGRATATRFPGMDKNGDGTITRAEWTGSDRSFQVHDWNRDGRLSGDEVRVGAPRNRGQQATDFDSPDREYEMTDWTARNFANLDHNRDGVLTREEWHFDRESFRRADHNRDGRITRAEFLGTDLTEDDDREDRFRDLDVNRDGRITRTEWHGAPRRFDMLDDDRDGTLTRAEILGSSDAPPDLFASIDVNGDRTISLDEWHWLRGSFDSRDANRDGRLTREEFTSAATTGESAQSAARKAGYERGMAEGLAAGRGDRENGQGWDVEGQTELEGADSGYEPRVGPRAHYQAGYRDGFRRGYREGFGTR